MFARGLQSVRDRLVPLLRSPCGDELAVGNREKQRSKATLCLVRLRERIDRKECFLAQLFGPSVIRKPPSKVGVQNRAVSGYEPIKGSSVTPREGGHQKVVGRESHHRCVC